MTRNSLISPTKSLLLMALVASVAGGPLAASAAAQKQSPAPPAQFSSQPSDVKPGQALPRPQATAADADDPFFRRVYKDFYNTYKLGPDDEVAIRVLSQPDYSLEKVKISPVGRIYHPLLGDVEVAGLTVDRLTEKLTLDLSQYIINPKISVSLLEAHSAKIGVLGDVGRPGVVIMTTPMTVLDAITASGGFTDFGSKSNVTILRQSGYDRPRTMKVNVKRILEAKADPEQNIRLQAGDTIIVHGNARKKFGQITSLLGFGHFLAFIAGR
ncbi:MAG TPA: polysaccharide biosynthesis/export family protein [Blastocatellia bacterium]|jgi:polysaccharide export outer membrane protein|nr:polysaccharide biosynthesis/export family protein [Blastocatellia bacterium]